METVSPPSPPLSSVFAHKFCGYSYFLRAHHDGLFLRIPRNLIASLRSDCELIASLLPVQPVHHVQKYHQIAIQVGVKGAFWELGGGGSAQASGIAARKDELFNNIQSHNASQISIPA